MEERCTAAKHDLRLSARRRCGRFVSQGALSGRRRFVDFAGREAVEQAAQPRRIAGADGVFQVACCWKIGEGGWGSQGFVGETGYVLNLW